MDFPRLKPAECASLILFAARIAEIENPITEPKHKPPMNDKYIIYYLT